MRNIFNAFILFILCGLVYSCQIPDTNLPSIYVPDQILTEETEEFLELIEPEELEEFFELEEIQETLESHAPEKFPEPEESEEPAVLPEPEESEEISEFEEPNIGDSGLPAFKINTADREINSTEIWIDGATYTIYDSSGTKLSSGSLDIKGRGNTTWGMPKKPYSLKLVKSASMLGMPSHKRWQLMANYSDKTLLRTETAFRLGNIFDNLAWTPRSEQVDLFINEKYYGVYQLTEAIKIDTNRVNIEKIKKSAPNGGYILEIDVREGEEFNFTSTAGVVFCCSDPDKDLDEKIPGENKTLFEKIKEDVQKAEDVIYSESFDDPETGYRQYIDVGSFIDWYLVNELTKNNDAIFWASVYMYYDPVKQKYCLGPLWDFDISLGNIDYNGNDNPEGFWIKYSAWISRLFEDPFFVAQVKTRWNEKKSEVDGIFNFIDSRSEFISNAASYNFRKWPILDQYVWPNAVVTGSYSGEIEYLKSWLSERIDWLDGAIIGLE